MSLDVGVNCTVSVAGVIVPANISGTSPTVSRAMRPIVLALGLANNLVGYAPSTGARSGFTVNFDLPYTVAGSGLNSMLSNTPVTVSMQFGSAGGVSVAGCLATSFSVSGSEGGNISVSITYESQSMPTVGATVAAPPSTLDVFKFNDVTSFTLASGTTVTDVNSFTYTINRTLARYVGNSTTGIPKHIKATHTECSLMCEYLKVNDAEGTAFLGGGTPNFCPTVHDMVVNIAEICGTDGGTLTLTCASAFYQDYPKSTGATEDYVKEQVTGQAEHGGFTIA